MTTLYGISNCDTMKKARKWLAEHGIEYQFHDFKKAGLEEALLRSWVAELGWEQLINRRGMMWRKLDETTRANIGEASAIRIMLQIPSIIKRPLLQTGEQLLVGFDAAEYAAIFSQSKQG